MEKCSADLMAAVVTIVSRSNNASKGDRSNNASKGEKVREWIIKILFVASFASSNPKRRKYIIHRRQTDESPLDTHILRWKWARFGGWWRRRRRRGFVWYVLVADDTLIPISAIDPSSSDKCWVVRNIWVVDWQGTIVEPAVAIAIQCIKRKALKAWSHVENARVFARL